MTTRDTIQLLLQRRWDDPEPTPVSDHLYLYIIAVVVWIGLAGASYAATDSIQKAIPAETTLLARLRVSTVNAAMIANLLSSYT